MELGLGTLPRTFQSISACYVVGTIFWVVRGRVPRPNSISDLAMRKGPPGAFCDISRVARVSQEVMDKNT